MSSLSIRPTDDQILTVSQLRRTLDPESGKPDPALWVLNTSDLEASRPRGDLLIEVTKAGGRADTITLPNTWIPIDLSQFGRKADIIDSPGFMQQVNAGAITPIATEFAEKQLQRADVRETRNLLAVRKRAASQGSPVVQTNGAQPLPGAQTLAEAQAAAARAAEADDRNISPRVMAIMETDDNVMTPAQKLISLKALTDEIRQKELRYIMSRCDTSRTHEPIQRWVTDMSQLLGGR